jgi:hypothetical protein
MKDLFPKVEIRRLEWHAADQLISTQPEKSFREAFTKVDRTSMIFPADVHRYAIYFAWLQWHVDQNFLRISGVLTADVLRAVDAIAGGKIPSKIDERDFHDRMMIIAAILSGNPSTMRSAAEQVQMASSRAKTYQYESAFAGLLASRILDKPKQEKAQLRILRQYKPTRVDPWPSNQLLDAFSRRDYRLLAKSVKKGAEKHWTDRYLGVGHRRWGTRSVVVEERPDYILLDLWKKDPHFWWPYVEAAFAKLAILDGAEFSFDSFWLPLGLVQAMR